ncbi:membrane bound O-acyl transferase family-domain-containing protein [Xylaria digitata]|nr:membrane bound O-acyl transferase family-domain-containing protein [Xylaria digitata]
MAVLLFIACQAVALSTVVFVLAFTPDNSLIRPALLPLLTALATYTIPLNLHQFPHEVISNLLSMHTVGLVFQHVDFGLISRWSYSARGPTSSRGGQRNANLGLADRKKLEHRPPSLWQRLEWGLFAATAWRAPGTPWEVKGTPRVRPVPSRSRFLAQNLLKLAVSLLVIDILAVIGGEPKPEENAFNFAWDKVRFLIRLREVSVDEAVLRAVVLCVCWVTTYYSIQAFYCFSAIVGVATGVTALESWPPMFGSLTDMYTVRNFWGTFWHQSLRQKIGGPAYFTTYSLLGLKKGGVVGRYINIFLVFTLSGLYHLAAQEYSHGIRWQHTGTLRFFCTQALGILIEDAAQAGLRHSTNYRSNRLTTALGYLWVVLWLYWSSAAWFYPQMQDAAGKGALLPFSVIRPLLRVL